MTTEALTMNRDDANDLVKRFREDCDIRRLVSTRNYVSYADEYAKFIGKRGKSVLNADKEDLKAFLNHLRKRQIKETSIEVIFVKLSAFYTFLIEEGFTENIVLNITCLTYHVRIWESMILQRKDSSSGQESYPSRFL